MGGCSGNGKRHGSVMILFVAVWMLSGVFRCIIEEGRREI